MIRRRRPVADRFWEKVDFTESCWVWSAARTSAGYGNFLLSKAERQWVAAHRWAYEFCVGPIPAGLQIDHLCRNPPCVNPDHLEPVSNRTNTMRGLASIRMRNENPGAEFQAQKTHCRRGHEYTEENTYMQPYPPSRLRRGRASGYGRVCRACRRLARAA